MTTEDKDYLLDNAQAMPIKALARERGLTYSTVYAFFRKNSIDFIRDHEITKEQGVFIQNNVYEYSLSDLAKELDVPRERLKKYLIEEGYIEIRKHCHVDPQVVLENKHLTLVEMCELTGCAQSTISNHCYKNGITLKKRRKKLTERDKRFIETNTHKTLTELATELGYNLDTISKFCKRDGIELYREVYR